MFRLFIILLVAAGISGGVAYYNGWLDEYMVDPKGTTGGHGGGVDGKGIQAKELGDLLYASRPLPELPPYQHRALAQLVVDPCHAVVPLVGKQDVSSPKEGPILFVGRFVPEGKVIPGARSVPYFDGIKHTERWYEPLQEQGIVEENQVLVVIDPAQANHDLEKAIVKVTAAKAEYASVIKIHEVAAGRLRQLEQLRNLAGGDKYVTEQELGEARVTVAKYAGDQITKEEGIKAAEFERYQATLLQYDRYLQCKLPGQSVVKRIYKSRGEGIKPQEPVLQLWNMSNLKIEGSVDSQYFYTLQSIRNARCYLEPSVEMAPPYELTKSHRKEVHSVAVCADGEHFVSGSEDSKVYVWKRGQNVIVKMLDHHSPVQTVACSPKGRWVLAGCSDGSITLWDLTNVNSPKSVEFKDKHHSSVTALAFSPDGTHFASGGDDKAIMVWKSTGELLYTLDASHGAEDPHQGTITSLHFTPQCTLISAARDNTLRVWELHKLGAKRLGEAIAHRTGTVGQLGVSADGRFMLFDAGDGKSLQLLNTVDGSTVCVLDNLSGSNPFDTLAIFSPDGKMMLTGGAGEGRLHLWKTPTASDRAFQLRELVAKYRSAITSAAFAPAGGFAVTGSKDGNVQLWELPDNKAVESHLIRKGADGKDLQLDLVESDLNAGKTRIAVDFSNPRIGGNRFLLSPGQRMTVVVELSK